MARGFTPRQRVAMLGALALGLVVVGGAALGQARWGQAALGLLVAGSLVLLLDVRRRQHLAARQAADTAARTRRIEQQVTGKLSAVASLDERLASLAERLASLSEHVASADRRAERAEDRVLSTLTEQATTSEQARTELLQQLESILTTVQDRDDREGQRHRRVTRTLRLLEHEPVSEVQSLLQLMQRVEARAPLPGVGGWALEPSTLLEVVHLIEERHPALVVECGSGASTLWIAYALRSQGSGRVVALEHDEHYAEQTRDILARHGLEQVAQVRTAPLRDVPVDGHPAPWYDLDGAGDLTDIDLLLVDGPPQATGALARYPALRQLGPRLAAEATVVLDDAHRPDEAAALERWLAEHDGLQVQRWTHGRAVVLSYLRPGTAGEG